jgi:polyisoprenoid-binding protein YceI
MSNRVHAAVGAAVLTLVLLTPWTAAATLTKPSAVGVKFVAAGPAGVSIVGKSSALRVNDDGQLITFVAPLGALETGIELRDRHMKEKYLEVGKYPNAELRVDRKALSFPAPSDKLTRDARGELMLHGHKKAVVFHYVATRDASGYAVSASFVVNMKDYAIDVPSYLGVTVKPDVEISLQFHVMDN